MNKVIMTGRFTKEHELRYTGNGTAVVNNTIAVDDGFGEHKRTDFINVVYFGKIAEVIALRSQKGTQVNVIGNLRMNTYTNSNGQKVYSYVVHGEEIDFLQGKKSKPELAVAIETVELDSAEDSEFKRMSATYVF